jgi:2',3'-cyclic-nucleotide 2'-phosphodiesterase (5'-nucleotidase family)
MTNLINNLSKFYIFIVLLTLSTLFGCGTQRQDIAKITSSKIPINQTISTTETYENYIAPYRNHINKDLDSVLSYASEDMDKSNGKWQTTIGNFLADITLEKANVLFYNKYHKKVDLCILNHGGIRAPISKGNITTRTAYQIMPFENNLFIAELKGAQIIEMVNYFVAGKKAHPLAGIEIELYENQSTFKSIKIQGEALDVNKTYLVATSDYLITGGDNMTFFDKAITTFDMNYKLRNLIIDYFKENDTIPVVLDRRVH